MAHTTPIARTRKHIWGLPGLTTKHAAAVHAGNMTAQVSSFVITSCISARVPCCRENPRTSKLFRAPCIFKLLSDPHCQEFVSDYTASVAPRGANPPWLQHGFALLTRLKSAALGLGLSAAELIGPIYILVVLAPVTSHGQTLPSRTLASGQLNGLQCLSAAPPTTLLAA